MIVCEDSVSILNFFPTDFEYSLWRGENLNSFLGSRFIMKFTEELQKLQTPSNRIKFKINVVTESNLYKPEPHPLDPACQM